MEPFCVNHVNGLSCAARVYDFLPVIISLGHYSHKQCIKCPYTVENIQHEIVFGDKSRLYISQTEGDPFVGGCQDFKPLDEVAERLIKKSKK